MLLYSQTSGSGAHCANDVALRRRADEIERIAGDERDGGTGRRVEGGDVFRLDGPATIDAVADDAVQRLDFEEIADANVLEGTEEPVAVRRDPRVARGGPPRRR